MTAEKNRQILLAPAPFPVNLTLGDELEDDP